LSIGHLSDKKTQWNGDRSAGGGFQTMTDILSGKTQDRRIAKTRAALARSLFALMQRYEWEHITIQALCDEADVARSSFYAHYDSLGSLLDAVVSANMPAAIAAHSDGGGASTLDWLIDHVSANKRLFHHTVNSPSGAAVLSRFKAAVKNALRDELELKGHAVTEAGLSFLIGGTFEALHTWAAAWRMERIAALKTDVAGFAAVLLAANAGRDAGSG
jgi:AcrR family transcriptional regulator